MRPWLLLSAALVLAVCPPGCKKNDISQTNNTGTTKIGAKGGTVNGPDGVQVRVPGGALTADTGIGIDVAQPDEYPPLPSSTYDTFGKVYAFTPHGLTFLTPSTVSLPNPGGGTTLLTADLNGSWAPIASQARGSALEAGVTGFSFFVVGAPGGGVDGGASCSGRGASASAPTGALSGLNGVVPASGPAPAVDLATMVDGFAVSMPNGNPDGLDLVLTSYPKACGTYENGVVKLGEFHVVLRINSQSGAVTTATYSALEVQVATDGAPASWPAGACSLGGSGGPSSGIGGLTITALDASHVVGNFDITPTGMPQLAGTFDVPICAKATGLNPGICCLP